MGNLYDTIIALCESRGIKGGKMCRDIGISKGFLTDLKMGRRTGMSAVTAQKIAAYFDVSVGYLLGEEKETKIEQPDKKTNDDDYVFYDRFVELCDINNVSRTKACTDCGISRTAWKKWQDGGIPNGATISKLAEYFNISVADFLDKKTEHLPFALYNKIRSLCRSKGVSASRMCLDLGLSKSTLSGLKHGKTKKLSIPTSTKIANYFEITLDELYGKTEQPVATDGLSEKKMAIMELVKSVPDERADYVLRVMKSILEAD